MINHLDAPVRYMDWDSNFFKKRIARITSSNLTEEQACAIDAWAESNQIDCLYYLAEGVQQSSPWTAERHGYHLMDMRVTFGIDLLNLRVKEPGGKGNIRLASHKDLPDVKKMAGEFHTQSRFFADEHFSRDKCRQLYEIWIEKDFSETDRFLWIWEEDGYLAGYTSASINTALATGDIGLVGVNPNWRGKGIGVKLQQSVLAEMIRLGIRKVEVVTQGRNIAAQNLYHRSGYQLQTIDLWYHKWFERP